MAWWSRARQNKQVSEPKPKPARIVLPGAFDYEKTPGVWFWRDEQIAFRTLRVYLSGNRPLTRLGDGYDEDQCMSYDEYRAFRLALVQITSPDVKLEDLYRVGTWGVAIHKDYVALHQVVRDPGKELERNVHSDEVLQAVLGILRQTQEWTEWPLAIQLWSHPTFGGGRWSPSS